MNWGILAYMKSGSSIKRRRLQALDVNEWLGNEQHKRKFIYHSVFFSLLSAETTLVLLSLYYYTIPALGISKQQHPFMLDLYDMVIDPWNPNYFCLGGNDAYARVYDMRKCWQDASGGLVKPVNTFRPAHLIQTTHFMITGLAYSNSGELLVSYSDEHIYLFQKNMGLGHSPSFLPKDMAELDMPEQFVGHRNINTCRVSFFGPNDEYVLSGSYCGHIFIWKKNGGELIRVMMGDSLGVHDIQPHPHNPVIATGGSGNNLKLWTPMANDHASPLPDNITQIMESNSRARSDDYFQMLTWSSS